MTAVYGYYFTPKQSVIIEDLFGLDHQFLKGHKYVINIDDTEQYIKFIGSNYVSYEKKKGYFLSKEMVEKHFDIVRYRVATGGSGHSKVVGWEYSGEKGVD
jgi:hypothetical protein